MISITVDEFTLWCEIGISPLIYNNYRQYAKLVDEFDINNGDIEQDDMNICVIMVEKNDLWPFLIISQRYAHSSTFFPGMLIVPETNRLFVGAGSRLLAYDLLITQRLWEDSTAIGFSQWKRYKDWVIMSAEVELAVWDIYGQKKWSTFVEPPWSYTVEGELLHIDVMGNCSSFHLSTGPSS